MSLVDDCLPILDDAEALLDELGFNKFDITMRVVSWTGGRVSQGARIVTDTPLTLDGTHRFNVDRISSYNILASGGKYIEGDYRVGPITPTFAGGGRDPSFFSPTGASIQEVLYRVTGPGFESGVWFKKIDVDTSDPFGFFFTLRQMDPTPL